MFQYHNIVTAEQNLAEAKRKYLEAYGWKCTCQTPGSHWLWTRDFSHYHKDYGIMHVSQDTAIAMTRATLDDTEDDDDGG